MNDHSRHKQPWWQSEDGVTFLHLQVKVMQKDGAFGEQQQKRLTVAGTISKG